MTTKITREEFATMYVGNTWARATLAYHNGVMEWLTDDELNEILATVDHMNFLADMSDDYKVTCKERNENNAIARKAEELLAK